jgi:hypothetical protein
VKAKLLNVELKNMSFTKLQPQLGLFELRIGALVVNLYSSGSQCSGLLWKGLDG